MTNCEIDIHVAWTDQPIDVDNLRAALQHALAEEQVGSAILSVTIVDNESIHAVNQDHLQHDFPTDVISFALEWTHPEHTEPGSGAVDRSVGAAIEGEILVGGEYAAADSHDAGWPLQSELTLYVVHGMLHICGYDDLSPHEKQIMRSREKSILSGLGLTPEYPDDEPPGITSSANDREPSLPEDRA